MKKFSKLVSFVGVLVALRSVMAAGAGNSANAIVVPSGGIAGPAVTVDVLAWFNAGVCGGYQIPCLSFGPRTEITFWDTLEVHDSFLFSPTAKNASPGHTVMTDDFAILWRGRFGGGGGVNYGQFDGSEFSKYALHPEVVAGVRGRQVPLRFYGGYLFPDGGSDLQKVQPNHAKGPFATIEAELPHFGNHLRLGISIIAPLTGLAQGVPTDPAAGRQRFTIADVSAGIAFVFRSFPGNRW